MDFNTAWQKARKGQQSGLFATEYTYGYPKPTQLTRKTPLTTKQVAYQHAAHHAPANPVWPEFAGHSSHRTIGYSQIVMEAHSKHAQNVFRQAEYTLSKLKERGW